MVVAAPHAEAAISCGQVYSSVSSCYGYLRGGPLAPACCSGVKSLNSKARTTPDRQAVCACLKNLAKGVNLSLAAGLPGKCGVNVGYPISPSVDCSKVK
ncbi:non-specific lipid-transfer protein [Ralstonia pseudosolanacearum]